MTMSLRAGRSPLLFSLLLAASAAQAHMPYVLPNMFDATTRDHVSVIASFTETPFVADVAMKSDQYAVINPDGARIPVTQVHYLKDLAAFEIATPQNGLYRITSGERLGRKSKMWQKPDGSWEFVGEREAPKNVKVVDVQSVTTADAYISHGKVDMTMMKPTGVGVELQLQTAPHAIAPNQPVSAHLLFQGKPLANTEVSIYRGTLDGVDSGKSVTSAKSDAQGALMFTVPMAGTYLALIRHRTESPAGAETPWRSYSYTLTFAAE